MSATGSDVFVGPQAAALIGACRTAFERPDAIVAVSGPAGVGKSTLTRKAIAATGLRRKTMFVGPEPCPVDSVLPSLLMVLGINPPPTDRSEQLETWQQLQHDMSGRDTHLFIVIEDAVAIGAEVVEEFAALSAAGSESSPGARMVIMGNEALDPFAEESALAALRERLSLRHELLSFSEAEMRGYLKHAFRIAGGSYDALFEDDCLTLLMQLSEGIPGTANAIIETVLGVAAEQDIQPITAKLIADVAAKVYDAEADRFEFRPSVAKVRQHEQAKPVADDDRSKVVALPDLDALARAIATAHGDDDKATSTGNGAHSATACNSPTYATSETSREKTITCGMDSAGEFGLATDIVTTTMTDSADDLDKVAARLAEARTLEDVDDAMAETLFGSEIEQIASAVTSAENDTPPSQQRKQSAR